MNKIRLRIQILGFTTLFLAIGAIIANAMAQGLCDDATMVQRSELIVVGHLKANSIRYVPHTNTPAYAAPADGHLRTNTIQVIAMPPTNAPWEAAQDRLFEDMVQNVTWGEHRAILVVSEVIKGKSTNVEISIIIHYGLKPIIAQPLPPKETNRVIIRYGPEPVVRGNELPSDFMMDDGGGSRDYPANLVRIVQKQGTQMILGERPLVEDASKDNLWFLRRGSGIYGEIPGTNDLGVMGPQDIRPLSMKEYFELYLSKNPEEAVKSYAAKHPEFALRAQWGLNHLRELSGLK